VSGLVFAPSCAAFATVALLLAPPRGTVRVQRFFAPALGVEKHYVIYLPPSYATAPGRRYSVAFYLHGLTGNESDWVSLASIDVIADSLIAGGSREMILVMPDGDDGWYTNWAAPPQPYAECLSDTLLNRAAPAYCVPQARYEAYVARDLVHHIDSTYRTVSDRRHRGIAGLSMGGYGAVTIALAHPHVFSAAASHSGVLSPLYAGPHPFVAPARYHTSIDSLARDWGGMWTSIARAFGRTIASWEARDPAHLARRLHAAGGPMPDLFVDVGTQDGLVDQSRALHAEVATLGISDTYSEWPGKHDWKYWHAHVGESLRWLAERIAR
jgi:putative tributyrin esterase